MSKHLDKSRAITITRLAQGGFALLACGAAATAYIGLPMAQPPTEKDFVVAGAAPVRETKEVPPVAVDISGSAARLGQVANAPRVEPPASVTPTGPDVKQPEAPAPAGLSEVKYLGFANVGTIRMALLTVDAKQKFVREGQALNAERVKSIDPDSVVLTHENDERRIPLEERSGERVTRLRGGPPMGNSPQPVGVGRVTGAIQPPNAARPGSGGVKGLSKLPEEYQKWPPAYQRRFDRMVNNLLGQGEFPDEFSLIEKTRSALEAEGITPENKEKLQEFEKADAEQAAKDAGANGKKPEK